MRAAVAYCHGASQHLTDGCQEYIWFPVTGKEQRFSSIVAGSGGQDAEAGDVTLLWRLRYGGAKTRGGQAAHDLLNAAVTAEDHDGPAAESFFAGPQPGIAGAGGDMEFEVELPRRDEAAQPQA